MFDRKPQKTGNAQIPANVSVKNGEPCEIKGAYKTAHYGFILRDDDSLNRVACPTKLMEYIQFGIVPIVKSEDIGDFGELGLHKLPVERFMRGESCKPDGENGRDIAESLNGEYRRAVGEIVKVLHSQIGNI